MRKTLAIFSGLPGTGKSTLAQLAAQKLRIPLLGIDHVVDAIPQHLKLHANPFWEDMIRILLSLVDIQLELGFSVIVDSVFMGEDRQQARQLADKHHALFRPIYTFLSDEELWEQRVQQRVATAPPDIQDEIATWESIQQQRKDFYPWKPNSALFVDGVASVEHNLDRVLKFITAVQVELEPL